MFIEKRSLRAFAKLSIIALCLMVSVSVITGCDLAKNQLKIDRSGNMEFQDYRDSLAPRLSDKDRGIMDDDSEIPELKPYVAQPSENLRPMPLVSISVNQTVPLRDALFELANQAGYDIELDPNIQGSIIFTARQRPLDVVVERIADIAGLRYKFDGDSIRVEVDNPIHRTYKIDYLNYIRRNKSQIRNDVSVVRGEGADTGSSFESSAESEADFWGELNAALTQIIGAVPNTTGMRTANDPTITAAASNPTAAPVQPVVTTNPDGSSQVNVVPPQTTLQVQSLPTDMNNPNASTAPVTPENDPNRPTFALNKQAGVISVFAPSRTHERVAKYLDLVRRSVTSQVLIEAKVLEVALNDEYASGIEWAFLDLPQGSILGFDVTGNVVRPALSTDQAIASSLKAAVIGSDFGAAVQAISRFGTVHALASPRLTVINNQSAALNVSKNLVYFELNVDYTAATQNTPASTSVDSEIRNVPEGVLINVQPSIDLDTQTISMSVRPTITRVTDYENDPAVIFAAAQAGLNTNIVSRIPVVNVQEFDSVISMNSGQTVVLGGLLQDRSTATQEGVPVLSEVPLLGGLFRNHVDQIQKTELVVFLRATILDNNNGSIHATDRELYKRFGQDRRPINF